MSTTVAYIVGQVSIHLNDVSNIRWTTAELTSYIHDGEVEAVVLKPEANAQVVSIPMASGTRQQIPSNASTLIDAVRNISLDGSTPGKIVRMTSKDTQDAVSPDWHTETKRSYVNNAMYDIRNPRVFYVYPPQDGMGNIEAVCSIVPGAITYGGNITLVDEYANCLIDYTIYRALSREGEVSLKQEAISFYKKFANALGVKLSNAIANNPNTTNMPFNPDVPAAAR